MQSSKVNIFVLHGWAMSAHNQQKWQPFIDLLEESGHQVFFLPVPGLSRPLTKPWMMADYLSWLDDEIRQINAKNPASKTVLIGHSFGGHIVLKFDAQTGEKLNIAGLVLIDSSGIRIHSLKIKFKRWIFKHLAKLGKKITRQNWAKHALYKLARERDYLQADPNLQKTMANILAEEVVDDLKLIKIPVKIIWGSSDQVTPLSLGRQIHEYLPHSTLEIIEGGRHSPQFTHTDQVVKIINTFIKTL